MKDHFSFYRPFSTGTISRQRIFGYILLISLTVNGILVLFLGLANDFAWLNRTTAWNGLFNVEVRNQKASDSGCEFAAYKKRDGKEWSRFLAQPVNALSNFTFSLSGLIIIQLAFFDFLYVRKNGNAKLPNQFIIRYPSLSFFLGASMCSLAVCSFLWHGSLATYGADIDNGATYLMIVYTITLLSMRILHYLPVELSDFTLSLTVYCISFIGFGVGISFFAGQVITPWGIAYAWFDMDAVVFFLVLVMLIISTALIPVVANLSHTLRNTCLPYHQMEETEVNDAGKLYYHSRHSWGLYVLGLLSIAYGVFCRYADMNFACDEWTGPESFIQFHAMWHTFCSFAILFVYLFMRSEDFSVKVKRHGRTEGDYDASKGLPVESTDIQIDTHENAGMTIVDNPPDKSPV
eukprot:g2392.t1